jgi:Mg-chelatase subunit ChlI
MLIKTFCELAGVDREGSASRYFEYLLTPFTEPGELFGFYDPSKLTNEGRLERIHADSMMQSAHVVFLDEVFKGSSAILNALLSFMNERAFYDRGRRHSVPLQCLFAATNELPDSDELQAIWDRFTLRCRLANVAADRGLIQDMLTKAWPLTYGARLDEAPEARTRACRDEAPEARSRTPSAPLLLEELQALRNTIRGATGLFEPETDTLGIVTQLVELARTHGLSQVSNRRMVKFVYVMLVHRVYDCVRAGDASAAAIALRPEELRLLPKYFLDQESHEEGVRQLHAAIVDWHAERSAVA